MRTLLEGQTGNPTQLRTDGHPEGAKALGCLDAFSQQGIFCFRIFLGCLARSVFPGRAWAALGETCHKGLAPGLPGLGAQAPQGQGQGHVHLYTPNLALGRHNGGGRE